MNENDVIDLLKKAEHTDVNVWITGGWGVDALIGHQTRLHNDIDFFIQKKDTAVFIEMLSSNGYYETARESDDQQVWCDTYDRVVDLHFFEFAEKGTLRFENEIYPLEIFNGNGKIGEITVRCLTAEAQVKYHQGYEHKEKDTNDVLLLCKTFRIPIPEKFVTQ